MLELFFNYAAVLARLRQGPLTDAIEHIAGHLARDGYARLTAVRYLSLLGSFNRYAGRAGRSGSEPIDQALLDRFLAEIPRSESMCTQTKTALGHLSRYLAGRYPNAFPPASGTDPGKDLLSAFDTHLRDVRGLRQRSREGILHHAAVMLAWYQRHRPGQPLTELSGQDMLAFVTYATAQCATDASRSAIVSHVRAFLRYLHWAGMLREDLAPLVPHVPCWRMAQVPEHLSWNDVRRVIDAIDPLTGVGKRDRAILLLLATTGLRGQELRQLELRDVHWRTGEIHVRATKSRREHHVPLLEETGKALASYRDALRLLILYAAERMACKPCRLTVANLDRELVLDFLDDLEQKRKNTVRTRNARLTAIRSFFHHVAASDPASLGIAQRIIGIPSKRTDSRAPRFLDKAALDALLNAPDRTTARGRRDHALLLFLARTGARVSEALGVDAADLRLDPPAQVLLRGKGRKQRWIPLAQDLARTLLALCRERGLGRDEQKPIFVGVHGERLTRFGATHVVRRAVNRGVEHAPQLARTDVSPHLLRHTLAMQLLQSGVDLVTIQAWLGHAQVATTHRYAEADVEMMRRSLERANVSPSPAPRFRPKDSVLRLLETR